MRLVAPPFSSGLRLDEIPSSLSRGGVDRLEARGSGREAKQQAWEGGTHQVHGPGDALSAILHRLQQKIVLAESFPGLSPQQNSKIPLLGLLQPDPGLREMPSKL